MRGRYKEGGTFPSLPVLHAFGGMMRNRGRLRLLEYRRQRAPVHNLLLDEPACQRAQCGLVLLERGAHAFVRGVEKRAHFGIDGASGVVAVFLFVRASSVEEHGVAWLFV